MRSKVLIITIVLASVMTRNSRRKAELSAETPIEKPIQVPNISAIILEIGKLKFTLLRPITLT